jgi:hypothetical protein
VHPGGVMPTSPSRQIKAMTPEQREWLDRELACQAAEAEQRDAKRALAVKRHVERTRAIHISCE